MTNTTDDDKSEHFNK